MTKILNYSIIGLQDYRVSFDNYCVDCEIQKNCKHGRANPFTIMINCTDLNRAKEKIKLEQLNKLQKKADVSISYEDLIKRVKINLQGIFSAIWKEKIKTQKEVIRCLDSQKVDPILVSQQGQNWWQNFASTMKEINKECEKVI